MNLSVKAADGDGQEFRCKVSNIKCAWVFAGGDFSAAHFPLSEVADHHLIVCVDRGVEHCMALGLLPTLLVGDFDSASEPVLTDTRLDDVPRKVYSSDKAASDLELTLDILCAEQVDCVVIVGVSGGRTDHMLFNWMLPVLKPWPFSLKLIDETIWCHVLRGTDMWMATTEQTKKMGLLPNSAAGTLVTPKHQAVESGQAVLPSTFDPGVTYQISIGQTVSLMALSLTSGVNTQGLQYPLSDAVLQPGSTLGLSNVVNAEAVSVSTGDGTLLLMVHRENGA